MKLGIVIEETWDFFREIYADLSEHHQTSLFQRRKKVRLPFFKGRINHSLYRRDLQSFLRSNDVVFFEWASEILAHATQLPKTCGIVTRLHRYEIYQWADQIRWENVDRIILVSQAKRREFAARFPDQASKVVVIPEAVSVDRFQFHPRQFGGDIGTLCRLQPRKRVYEIILAFYELLKRRDDFHLHIGGGKRNAFLEYYEALHALVGQLNLGSRVTFYDNVPDPENWYPKIDVFISNSYSEGLQVSPMEAMSCGCYCLSHRWDGADELLPEENLFYSEAELIQEILCYDGMPEVEKHKARARMREIVCDKFDVNRTKILVRQVVEEGEEAAVKIGYLMQAGVPEVRTPPFDGPANHVRQVFKELVKRGHTLRLLAIMDGRIWKSDDLESFQPVTVRWIDRGPLRWFESGVRRIQRLLRLPYLAFFESLHFALACRQELKGFDVLYERSGWVGYGGGMAAGWMNVPLVLEENGNHLSVMEALGNAPKGFQRRLSEALMDRAMRRADHVIASGEGWRKHFIERYRVDPTIVTTVENGTEVVSLLNRQELRSFGALPGAQESARLVYIGGFYPWHGVDNLLRALSRALGGGARARLLLIGSGVGEEQARQSVEDLHLSQVVTFTGQLSPREFAPLLAASDIGLSPYCGWKEFSGLKILDYKAAGLATIASGLDGKPPTLQHGVTGWIVPPCDEDALCDAITRLSMDAELRRQMGQAARIEAEKFHGWDATVRQLENVFVNLLNK